MIMVRPGLLGFPSMGASQREERSNNKLGLISINFIWFFLVFWLHVVVVAETHEGGLKGEQRGGKVQGECTSDSAQLSTFNHSNRHYSQHFQVISY